MAVYNVHERLLAAKGSEVGALVNTISGGPEDRLWPGAAWPPVVFDRGLAVGSAGGHGPIHYTVSSYVPDTWVRFTFTGPRGFHGFHEFAVLPVDGDRTVLRHTLAMRTTGLARVTWPLVYRPLHDALIEDSLDRGELGVAGALARRARWSPYVRFLRALMRRGRDGVS